MKKYFILVALILIQGCSSGGDSTPILDATPTPTVPITNADATGVWKGTITEDGVGTFSLTGIITGDKLRFISEPGGIVYAGFISVKSNGFFSTIVSIAHFDGSAFGTSTLIGTVTSKSTISGTFRSSTGAGGSFSLSYDIVTDKGSSLAITDGNWTETSGGLTSTISIVSTGALTGSDTSGCVYLGTVSEIDPSVNIYNLSLGISSCGVYDSNYVGYIVMSDTVSTNDTLYFVINNSRFILINELTRT